MTIYEQSTAALEDSSIPQQKNAYATGTDPGRKDATAASSTMPALGTKEFEELSRSLDTRPMGYRFIKRTFDIVMSLCVFAVLILLWPFTLALLIVIAVQTKGFPIYIQERVGQYGRTIKVPKLRSMVVDSENVEKYLDKEQMEEWRKERKVTNDPRIVPIGAFIRKTSLDELSNFVLALTGGMSVVGPRPIVVEETDWYRNSLPLLLSVPQGITGWWQCTSRNNATFESGCRQAAELAYCKQASVMMDMKIMAMTLKIMFIKRNGR